MKSNINSKKPKLVILFRRGMKNLAKPLSKKRKAALMKMMSDTSYVDERIKSLRAIKAMGKL